MSGADTNTGMNRREVAYRVFAVEFNEGTVSYSASEEERAPNYVLFPTGVRANRTFTVGVLTAVETVGDNVVRARVADPTGVFVIYAGQYQPEAQTELEQANVPSFVAVTGKPRTFSPDDTEMVYTSIRPESITEVDKASRDRWVVQTTRHTLNRIDALRTALAREERGDELESILRSEGVESVLAAGIPLILEHYDVTDTYLDALEERAIQATEVIADRRESVEPFETTLRTIPADETSSQEPEPIPASGAPSESEPAEVIEPSAVGDSESDEIEIEADEMDEAPSGSVDTDELYEFDEGEREAIEDEYGTDFSTGTEIEEQSTETEVTSDTETTEQNRDVEKDDSGTENEADEPGEDLVDTVIDVMQELDDEDGSTKAEITDAIQADFDFDEETIEDAIEDALMSGRCYEPEEGKLKPI